MLRLEPGNEVAGLRIERELGRGAFGVVYLAEDVLVRRKVALKLVSAPGAHAPDRARSIALREARAAGRVKSPYVVALHRLHPLEDQDGWLLEMEYVGGGSLSGLLKEEGRLDADRALRLLRQILEALRTAHDAGVVHGDIKPGNVLLDSAGNAKLADFGLSWMRDDQSISASVDRGAVGTPIYMAPEVIMGGRASVASDLWSVGVMLYRMLSGRLPFRSNTLHELFFSVQNSTPEPLPVHVPVALQGVVLHLLAKEPDKRPSSAADVLAATALAGDEAADVPPVALPEPERTVAPPLVGRSKEREELQGLVDLLDGEEKGAAALVTGEAGVGKTALLRSLSETAQDRDLHWVEATATPLEGTLRPLLRGANRALAVAASTMDALAAAVGSGFTANMLRDLLQERVDVSLNSRQQVAWALEQVFLTLARERPLVLVVENAHQADAEDHKLLRELARRLPAAPILILISYRTHDVESSVSDTRSLAGYHELASVEGIRHVALPPLSRESVLALLQERAGGGRVDPDIAQRVIEVSGGNPLFAEELLRHLEETGAVRAEDRGLVATGRFGEASLPGRFHDLVALRLAGLSERQRALLDVAAVDGREFDGEALEAVADRPLLEVLRDLQNLCRDRNLVEPHGDGYRFTSTLFQEVIYNEAAPALRRAIHRQLAEHLEARGESAGVDPERLALHWDRAGRHAQAVPHYLEAASLAAKRQEYRRVIHLSARAGLPEQIEPDAILGSEKHHFDLIEALQTLGREEEATAAFQRLGAAAAISEDLSHRLCVAESYRNFFSKGAEAVDEESLRLALASLASGLHTGRARYVLGLVEKHRGALQEAERWLTDAEAEFAEHGFRGWQGSTLVQLASIKLRAGQPREARDLFRRAAEFARSVGRSVNAVVSDVNSALASLELGELEGLEAQLERGVRTLTLESGVGTLVPSALVILARVRYAEGRTDAALSAVRTAQQRCQGTDYLPSIESVALESGHLNAVVGNLRDATRDLEQARSVSDQRDHALGVVSNAVVSTQLHCFRGDIEAARTCADAAVAGLVEVEGASRSDLSYMLSEAVLYGLPVECVRDLPEGEPQATAFASAVAALGDAERSPQTLLGAAEDLADRAPGPRRAALQILGLWFRAEYERRLDKGDRAAELATLALDQAMQLRHIWLEARLLDYKHGLNSGGPFRKRLEDLVFRVADGNPDDAAAIKENWLGRSH